MGKASKIVFCLLLLVVSYAPSASTTGTQWAAWTFRGNNHCVHHRITGYSPRPLKSGDLLEWLGSTTVCDGSSAPNVRGVRLVTSVKTPATGCTWANKRVSGGTVTALFDEDGHTGSASWYETRNGQTVPAESIGVTKGRRSEALIGVCPGNWRITLTTFVLESASARWVEVGTNVLLLSVGSHPSLGSPRSANVRLAQQVEGNGHCTNHLFKTYGPSSLKVGDLFEYLARNGQLRFRMTSLVSHVRFSGTWTLPTWCPALNRSAHR